MLKKIVASSTLFLSVAAMVPPIYLEEAEAVAIKDELTSLSSINQREDEFKALLTTRALPELTQLARQRFGTDCHLQKIHYEFILSDIVRLIKNRCLGNPLAIYRALCFRHNHSSLLADTRNNILLARIMLESGFHPNYRDNFGFTALHFAYQTNNTPYAELLASHDADHTIRTAYTHRTPEQMRARITHTFRPELPTGSPQAPAA